MKRTTARNRGKNTKLAFEKSESININSEAKTRAFFFFRMPLMQKLKDINRNSPASMVLRLPMKFTGSTCRGCSAKIRVAQKGMSSPFFTPVRSTRIPVINYSLHEQAKKIAPVNKELDLAPPIAIIDAEKV